MQRLSPVSSSYCSRGFAQSLERNDAHEPNVSQHQCLSSEARQGKGCCGPSGRPLGGPVLVCEYHPAHDLQTAPHQRTADHTCLPSRHGGPKEHLPVSQSMTERARRAARSPTCTLFRARTRRSRQAGRQAGSAVVACCVNVCVRMHEIPRRLCRACLGPIHYSTR